MEDIEKKSSFDRMWLQKYKESKYRFESQGLFSNRRVRVWDIISCIIYGSEDRDRVRLQVIDKPSYVDSYNKIRYRGWLRCKEVNVQDSEIIICNVGDIVTLEREGRNIKW